MRNFMSWSTPFAKFVAAYDEERVKRGLDEAPIEDARHHFDLGHSPDYAAFVDEGVEVAT